MGVLSEVTQPREEREKAGDKETRNRGREGKQFGQKSFTARNATKAAKGAGLTSNEQSL